MGLCGQIVYKEGAKYYFVECGGKSGGTVSLGLDEGVLTLCEVQVVVKASNVPRIPTYENVAQGKAASQGHNTASNAARAVDGDMSVRFRSKSCTWSESENGTWWRGDLEQDTAVRTVVILNRMDAFPERIDGVKVSVGDEECGALRYEAARTEYTVLCEDKQGSHVTVRKEGAGVLTLCEVMVLQAEELPTELIDEEDYRSVTFVLG